MRSVEVTAKTLEQARAVAAQRLGVPEHQLVVEVIEEPRRLLGIIGAGEYRIRATVALSSTTPNTTHHPEGSPMETTPITPTANDLPARVAGIVNALLEHMGLDARGEVREASDEEVTVEIHGKDAGHAIGRHGATLDAMQLLVAVIVNKGLHRPVRIILDAEGYRERRRQMLERMAHTHAAKAKQAGKEIVIPDLKPYERRIIHLALRDDPDVETYSEGEGDDRRLVISPKG
jgi:spoIIIJ-associated protein